MKRVYLTFFSVVLLLSLCGCHYLERLDYSQTACYNDGPHEIAVWQSAPFSFGSSGVSIIAKNAETGERATFESYISDDGGYGQVHFESVSETEIRLTLSGCEMEDKPILIRFGNTITFTE